MKEAPLSSGQRELIAAFGEHLQLVATDDEATLDDIWVAMPLFYQHLFDSVSTGVVPDTAKLAFSSDTPYQERRQFQKMMLGDI